jgi:hypothetical protein
MPAFNLREIEERYLGGQTPTEFLQAGGDAREYARQVFSRAVFGRDENPAAPDIGVEDEDDLVEALEAVLAPARARLRALENHRAGTQFQPLDPGSRTVTVQVRVPAALVARVDAVAGVGGRSAWIRDAIEKRLR